MERQEHLQWCKDRALEYLEPGEHFSIPDACALMMSDLNKHPETEIVAVGSILAALGLKAAMSGDVNEARRFIEGFN